MLKSRFAKLAFWGTLMVGNIFIAIPLPYGLVQIALSVVFGYMTGMHLVLALTNSEADYE